MRDYQENVTIGQTDTQTAGADPGIFVRGGGGPNHLKNFEKQKKNRQKGERVGGFSIYSVLVWLKSIFAIETAL